MAIILTVFLVLSVSILPQGVHMEKICSNDVINPHQRLDCGWPGISKDLCESSIFKNGRCCHDDSVPDVPHCFYGMHMENSCSKYVINPYQRQDCSWPGISKELCESSTFNKSRCCHDDSVPDVPHCFHGVQLEKVCSKDVINPYQRKDCGWPHISKELCESSTFKNGRCCFDDSMAGVPHCFHGVHMGKLCSKDVIDPQQRKDCGWPGISKDLCESSTFKNGRCCFDDSVPDVYNCFYGTYVLLRGVVRKCHLKGAE